MNFTNKQARGQNLNCVGLHCYENQNQNQNQSNDIDTEFQENCPGFEVYPTVIPHVERIIAIGDIHGDMNLAINFLKAGNIIEEIYESDKLFIYPIKERIYRLQINRTNNITGLLSTDVTKTYYQTTEHVKNQFEVVYRYYKINGEYYVKIVQEDNNPRYKNTQCVENCDFTRWFKWIGGKTYVVQVGDQIDRCRPYGGNTCEANITINDEDSDLEIMLFYDSLDRIAKKKGGRLFSLLGNHEIMNVMGDMRYVSHKGIKEYSPEPKEYDNGYINRVDKFKSVIAKKLACTRSTILVIGDYLFVHGGIAHKLAYNYKLIDVNAIIRNFLYGKLSNNNDIKKVLNSSRYSPLWYRRLAYIPPDSVNGGREHHDCKQIYDPIIKKINEMNFNQPSVYMNSNTNTNIKTVNTNININSNTTISTEPTIQIKGMVIGHTPQFTVFNQGITTACSNRIIRTDIGGSTAFDPFAREMNNPIIDRARIPQVMEILTNMQTKESSMRVLFYTKTH
jgi:hypothetical protein